jgi:glutaredoxin-like YruB-family protein
MTVKVYSTPTCPWCTRVKEYLSANNVDFVDYDVSSDREMAMEMINKSGQRGVPVIDIQGNIIIGFDQHNIDRLLNL